MSDIDNLYTKLDAALNKKQNIGFEALVLAGMEATEEFRAMNGEAKKDAVIQVISRLCRESPNLTQEQKDIFIPMLPRVADMIEFFMGLAATKININLNPKIKKCCSWLCYSEPSA